MAEYIELRLQIMWNIGLMNHIEPQLLVRGEIDPISPGSLLNMDFAQKYGRISFDPFSQNLFRISIDNWNYL